MSSNSRFMLIRQFTVVGFLTVTVLAAQNPIVTPSPGTSVDRVAEVALPVAIVDDSWERTQRGSFRKQGMQARDRNLDGIIDYFRWNEPPASFVHHIWIDADLDGAFTDADGNKILPPEIRRQPIQRGSKQPNWEAINKKLELADKLASEDSTKSAIGLLVRLRDEFDYYSESEKMRTMLAHIESKIAQLQTKSNRPTPAASE